MKKILIIFFCALTIAFFSPTKYYRPGITAVKLIQDSTKRPDIYLKKIRYVR